MRQLFSLAALLFVTAAPASALSNLVVQVNNAAGAPVPGAEVAALAFVNGNPDAANSRLGMTNASGQATFDALNPAPFNALAAGVSYQIFASSQGFAPSIVDQFNASLNGLTAAAPSASPATITVVLSSAGLSALGEISIDVASATPNSIVFSQVNLKSSGGGAAAYGITNTDGTGAGVMTVHDIHYASSGTYQINVFDPSLNRAISNDVPVDLNASTPVVVAAFLPVADFRSATPPTGSLDNDSGSIGGGLSADIIVTDTASVPVPQVGLSVFGAYQDSFGQWHYDNRGSQTDPSGRASLYGLTAGVTYYASVFGQCASNGVCYEGFQSTAMSSGFGAAPGANDFLYRSTATVVKRTYQLKRIGASSAQIAVNVQDQFGNPLPHAGVSLYPDWTPWATGGTCGSGVRSTPGQANFNTNAATGYVLLSGIPTGSYQLNAYTQYGATSFNGFAFGGGTQNGACPSSQQHLVISSDTTASPPVWVLDPAGVTITHASSVTVVVQVSTASNTGVVSGSLTFPNVVDLSASPVLITLNPQCTGNGPCNGGGFKAFTAASTGPVINYSIPVSSGQAYWMTFTSDYWGAITAGGSQLQVDLNNSTAAYIPVKFAPAGRVLGSLRKPDGSVFVPQSNQFVWVGAGGNQSWGNSQLAADGSFDIGGLLPGVYRFQVGSGSGGIDNNFPYTTKRPAQQLTVTANQDVRQDAYLDNAVAVKPSISVGNLPPMFIPSSCPPNGDCPAQTWETIALPAGSKLGADTLVSILAGGGPEDVSANVAGRFDFQNSTGRIDRCQGQYLSAPGFCVSPIPAKPGSGSSYDFYLIRKGGFDSANIAGGARPHVVVMGSTSNVIVSQSRATIPIFSNMGGPGGSTTTAQGVNMGPATNLSATPQAVLFGTFTITNMINQQQFAQLGGKFDNFLNYLPVVYVYDASGVFKAAGLGVPYPPAEAPFDPQLNASVANSNYTAFRNLIGPSGWGPIGYEIRGLDAGVTYNLVATSPNYPPFKTSVTLGVAQSTTTLNIDFDSNPGSTLSGVVVTTNSTALQNAQVTVSAQGYSATTLTTDASGGWSISGLGAGQYSLAYVAAGYVTQAAIVDVKAASSVSAPTVSMVAANASISGTVYTNNPICPAGSTSCAAFGRTTIAGATVVAYDDTKNVANPTAALPLYRAVTSSSGTYTITGISSGDDYKVFVNAPGYYVVNQSTLAIAGNRSGFDFALKPKPLTVDLYGHVVGANYEFVIANYKQFSDGSARISQSPYALATSTDVSMLFREQPDSQGVTQLLLDYPLSALTTGVTYVMHLEAIPNDPRVSTVTAEVPFGLNLPHNTCQKIDQALLGDESSLTSAGLPSNAVPIDIAGGAGSNSTALSLPAGGVIPIASTAIPSMCMSETDASAANEAKAPGVSTGAFASGVYTMTLSSINYTQKGVDLTLSYDQNGTSISDLAVYTYDSANQKWDAVPGLQTLDPVKGTISVKGLKSLASVLGKKAGTGLMAISDGRGYRPNAIVLRPDDTGIFAVMRPSQVSGGVYTGTTVRVFNFPNPFSLQTKSVTLNTTAGVCAGLTGSVVTDGTVIKYEIPAGISGTGVIRIYTLSGRLVREVDAGHVSPSMCYYTVWDGKNKNGQPVANGVYYGVLSVGGSKQSSGTFKLAVIK
ncbi:MAG: carboxypeptidase regulatory-like domain-containing protein [Elusimicrobia bacterium]|nr:carboxypeptidase regulatory-like domain-containing protein [Elusimicrobiota bacterium]